MTPLERTIVDAVAKAVQQGHRLRSLYLRPQDLEELGHPEAIGGLPVKRLTEKGRPKIYTKSGVALPIAIDKPAAHVPQVTPTEQLVLVSLLQGWPYAPKDPMRRRLQKRGLVAVKDRRKAHNGRACTIHEPRLTGAGEELARSIWDGLGRDQRAALRAAALSSGL